MFSKGITNSSQFLMMPEGSQNLYFHLGMNADDDGFVEHFAVMRMVGSKPDDLRVLAMRGFVHVFDDKVLLIRDWKENNYIQADRYRPSKYLAAFREEIDQLAADTKNGLLPLGKIECIQNGYMVDTQVRLGKVRLGNSNSARSRSPHPGFAEFYAAYPRKVGRAKAEKEWNRIKPDAATLASMLEALALARTSPQWTKDGMSFVPHPATWLSQRRWEDDPSAYRAAPQHPKPVLKI